MALLSQEQTTVFQAADLKHNDDCLKLLTDLYFNCQGQIKQVAKQLNMRRNTVTNAILNRMIPRIVNIWIYDCRGNLSQLAEKLCLLNDERFQKTLRWHQRFENHINSLHPSLHNQFVTANILRFLRNDTNSNPGITGCESEMVNRKSKTVVEQTDFSCPTDNRDSITRKVTQLKYLKFRQILIYGETGAGKGWLSKRIYRYLYPRGDKPMIHVNCAQLISAAIELFGSEKGSFTGSISKCGAFEKIANGGVLFLDEIDTLPLETQQRLLLVLSEERVFQKVGSVVPIPMKQYTLILATNQNLQELVQLQMFRNDLLGRISDPCIRLKTWSQQSPEMKRFIIEELLQDILDNDFKDEYSRQLAGKFKLAPEQIDELICSDYVYNIRGVRKQMVEFISKFFLEKEAGVMDRFEF